MNNELTKYLFLGCIIVIVILVLWKTQSLENMNIALNKKLIMGKPCNIDEDCGNGNFCYMGQCWGYWKGVPMPWSTCRNPYCGSGDPTISCNANPGQCLPYCKCQLRRGLGTTIEMDCLPKCGSPCTTNDECPPGCPACSHGICSAPNKDRPLY
jgi:hypothetical protein